MTYGAPKTENCCREILCRARHAWRDKYLNHVFGARALSCTTLWRDNDKNMFVTRDTLARQKRYINIKHSLSRLIVTDVPLSCVKLRTTTHGTSSSDKSLKSCLA